MAYRTRSNARAWHAITFAIALVAVILQLVLVIQGGQHLSSETDPDVQVGSPDLTTRIIRFCSYLTIWSNVAATVIVGTLVLDPARDGRVWRAFRLFSTVVLFGGGIVHFVLLRPILELHGADLLADKLLHVVVPILVVIGWVVFGPRHRVGLEDLWRFMAITVVWFAYTLVRGGFVDWYPYPFLDVNEHGYGAVLGTGVGVGVAMAGLGWLAYWIDERLPTSEYDARTRLRARD